jgi:hypothetical protein
MTTSVQDKKPRGKPLTSRRVWKVLAQRIIPELDIQRSPSLRHDSSTNNLIHRYRTLRTKGGATP